MQINEDLFTTIEVFKPLFGKSEFRGFVGPFNKVVGPIEPFSTVKPDIKPFTPTNQFGPPFGSGPDLPFPSLPGGFSPTRRANEEIQKIADEVKNICSILLL